MRDVATTSDSEISPLGTAMLRTMTGWVGLLGQLPAAEQVAVATEAVRILTWHLPAAEREKVLSGLSRSA